VTEPEESPTRALLVSLGGSRAPVILAIDHRKPDYVLFFVSPQSAEDVQSILRSLQHQPREFDLVRTPDAEGLADCYRALRDKLPSKLTQWGLTLSDLVVDYTGGTKSMSAAVVLAVAENVSCYSYVGGTRRDKDGKGAVLDGSENVRLFRNPLLDLIRQQALGRARLHFRTARYQSAFEELDGLVQQADPKSLPLLEALRDLAAGCREWDAFRHADARKRLGKAYTFLKTYALGAREPDLDRLVASLQTCLGFLESCSGRSTNEASLIRDLIANADRRARLEHKHEDAVARLYSCMERAARFSLREYSIDNAAVVPDQIPEAVRSEMVRRHGEAEGQPLKLPLRDSYKLLAALGHRLGARFLEREEEIQKLLALRNLSILGHGERPVYDHEYQMFRSVLLDLLELSESELPVFPELPEVRLP